jgi:hypothetical protein
MDAYHFSDADNFKNESISNRNIQQWITDGQREFANTDAQTIMLVWNLSVSFMIRACKDLIENLDTARSIQFTEANNEDIECDIYA